MAINFPSSPTTGDLYTYLGITYQWDGTHWVRTDPAITPITTVDNTISRFNGTTGIIQSSSATLDDTGGMLVPGATQFNNQITVGYVPGSLGGLFLPLSATYGKPTVQAVTSGFAVDTLYLNPAGGAVTIPTDVALTFGTSAPGKIYRKQSLGAMAFDYNGADRWYYGTTGLIPATDYGLNLGAAGSSWGAVFTRQVSFPATQSASADANTLDDYEEGTWTPTLTSDGTPPTVGGYASRTGSYTKIGRQVTINFCFQIITSYSAGTGNIYIGGNGFTSGSHGGSAGWIGSGGWEGVDITTATFPVFHIQANTTNPRYLGLVDNGNSAGYPTSGVTVSDYLYGTVTFDV